uniref:Uncharacterized protein n=1 Tax=candidate division CPR3 bacterium TaxID=2268181 RepID=A0A7C5YUS6_UNCC3
MEKNANKFKNYIFKAVIPYVLLVWSIFSSVYATSGPYKCEGEGCPPDLSGLEEIALRLFTMLITVIGVIVLALIVKSAFMVMTAGGDPQKKGKGYKQLMYAILGFIGILASYGLIVFIAKWLGLVEGPLSFVEGGRIVFRLMLP